MDRLQRILSSLSHLDLADQIVDIEPHAKGIGGFCDVYIGYSRKHKKKVAVKRVRVFLLKDEAFAKVSFSYLRSSVASLL